MTIVIKYGQMHGKTIYADYQNVVSVQHMDDKLLITDEGSQVISFLTDDIIRLEIIV